MTPDKTPIKSTELSSFSFRQTSELRSSVSTMAAQSRDELRLELKEKDVTTTGNKEDLEKRLQNPEISAQNLEGDASLSTKRRIGPLESVGTPDVPVTASLMEITLNPSQKGRILSLEGAQCALPLIICW